MSSKNPFDEDFDPNFTATAVEAEPTQDTTPRPASASSPFDAGWVEPEIQQQPEIQVRLPIITAPGAYPDIDGDLYHRVEICDAESISSTGLKTISSKSAYHYWWDSPLNPQRPAPEQKQHFNVGKGVHDLLLLQDLFPKNYFVLPEGFDARLKRWADVKDERDEAIRSGVPVLSHAQYQMVYAMAEQVEKNDLAKALIVSGIPEMTLAAKDPVTGVWIRSKPDILPDTKDIIPDIKTAISAHPDDFEKAATKFGYFQSAAHYMDIIELLYGEAVGVKRRFVLIVVESTPPHLVQIYHLDDEAIQMGRMLNRKALNTFAACLRTGIWPGYSEPDQPILTLHMTAWAQAQITRRVDSGELSWE